MLVGGVNCLLSANPSSKCHRASLILKWTAPCLGERATVSVAIPKIKICCPQYIFHWDCAAGPWQFHPDRGFPGHLRYVRQPYRERCFELHWHCSASPWGSYEPTQPGFFSPSTTWSTKTYRLAIPSLGGRLNTPSFCWVVMSVGVSTVKMYSTCTLVILFTHKQV